MTGSILGVGRLVESSGGSSVLGRSRLRKGLLGSLGGVGGSGRLLLTVDTLGGLVARVVNVSEVVLAVHLVWSQWLLKLNGPFILSVGRRTHKSEAGWVSVSREVLGKSGRLLS